MDTSSISIAVEKVIFRNETIFYFEDMQKHVSEGFPAISAAVLSVAFASAKSVDFRARCGSICNDDVVPRQEQPSINRRQLRNYDEEGR